MCYLAPDQLPELCRDPHHADPNVPHGDQPCEACPECLRRIQEIFISEHRKLHELEHAYHEPSYH